MRFRLIGSILQQKNNTLAANDIIEHQFKEGQSGNPNGRPKGSMNSKTILKQLLAGETELRNKDGQVIRVITEEEAIHLKQIQKAKTGDTRAYTAILDRLEGKPVQRVELEDKEVSKFASEEEERKALAEEISSLTKKDES